MNMSKNFQDDDLEPYHKSDENQEDTIAKWKMKAIHFGNRDEKTVQKILLRSPYKDHYGRKQAAS